MAYSNTTGQTTINVDQLISYAFRDAGKTAEEMTPEYIGAAKQALFYNLQNLSNRGVNLWTIEQGQIVMNTGQSMYPIPSDTIDLLDTVTRTGSGETQSDVTVSRISEPTYMSIPNKNATGRPVQVWVNRQTGLVNSTTVTLDGAINSTDTTITVSDASQLATVGFINIGTETIAYQNVSGNQLLNCFRGQNNTTAAAHTAGATVTYQNLPSITVWPTPDNAQQYQFVYWRMRRTQDAGGGVNVMDVPFRFIPCMIAGLAYYLGGKSSDLQRLPILKAQYDESWEMAAGEDREKAPDRLVPRMITYR